VAATVSWSPSPPFLVVGAAEFLNDRTAPDTMASVVRSPILLRTVIQGPAIAPRYSTARSPELPHSFGGLRTEADATDNWAIPGDACISPARDVCADTDRGRRAITATEDRPIVARDRLALELMDDPLATAEARTTSVIPTSSLLLGTTAWTGRHGEPRRARSADWASLPGPIWESTQTYEGTNQIQRVVMAKKLLG